MSKNPLCLDVVTVLDVSFSIVFYFVKNIVEKCSLLLIFFLNSKDNG